MVQEERKESHCIQAISCGAEAGPQGSIRGSCGHRWSGRGSGSHPEAEAEQRVGATLTQQGELRARGSERSGEGILGGSGLTEGEWAQEPSSKGEGGRDSWGEARATGAPGGDWLAG